MSYIAPASTSTSSGGPFTGISGTPTEMGYFDATTGFGTSDNRAQRHSVTKESRIQRVYTAPGPVTGFELARVAIVGNKEKNEDFIDGEAVTFIQDDTTIDDSGVTGLNDLSVLKYTGTVFPITFTLTVTATGPTDDIDWSDGTSSGTILLSGSPNTYFIGGSGELEIEFNSDTGHTLGDEWVVTITRTNVGTGTLIHQEIYSPSGDAGMFFTDIVGLTGNGVIGDVSGEYCAQFMLPLPTFIVTDIAYSYDPGAGAWVGSTDITGVSGNEYEFGTITGTGFGLWGIVADSDSEPTEIGGIIALIAEDIEIETGYVTYDDIGQTWAGSGILATTGADKLFAGIFNASSLGGSGMEFGVVSSIGGTDSAYFFPSQDGTAGQALVTDGAGRVSWGTAAGVSDINGETGSISITGSGVDVLTSPGAILISWTPPAVVPQVFNYDSIDTTIYSTNSGYDNGDSLYAFIAGDNAGANAESDYVTFIGAGAGFNASSSDNAIMIGPGSGYGSSGSSNAIFLGNRSGQNTGNPSPDAICIGTDSGFEMTSSTAGIFIGKKSGYEGGSGFYQVFIGFETGYQADNLTNSTVAIGYQAAYGLATVGQGVLIGDRAGKDLSTSSSAIGIGAFALQNATNSDFIIAIGYNAAQNTDGADNMIAIGVGAGTSDPVDNTGSASDFSILIGKNTSTGGFSNSIAMGGSAVNTATNQFMIGSSTRPINSINLNGDTKDNIVVYTRRTTLTASQVAALNTTPIYITPGFNPDEILQIIDVYAEITGGTTAYTSNTTLQLAFASSLTTPVWQNTNLLTGTTVGEIRRFSKSTGSAAEIVPIGDDIAITNVTGNPSGGNLSIDVWISYKIITV